MTGKTYLVTGAGRGLGTAITECILQTESDSRVIAAVRDTRNETVKRLEAENGDRVMVVRYDASDEQSPLEMARAVCALGITAVDIIIANAALIVTKDPVYEAETQQIRNLFETNVVGPLLLY